MAIDHWRPFRTSVSRWEPFRDLTDMQQEVNRLFDSFFSRPATLATGERIWMPLADMYETKDDVHVTFEIPGVREKEISISITGDVLTVKGERKWERDVKDEAFHRLERMYGKFERAVPLPVPVQSDKVTAAYRDGVLEVTLPKADAVKPREIKIDIA